MTKQLRRRFWEGEAPAEPQRWHSVPARQEPYPQSLGASPLTFGSLARVTLVLVTLVLGCLTVGCKRSAGTATGPPQPVSLPSDSELQELIDEVLDFTEKDRTLRSDVHAAWQILHGVLAYNRPFEIVHEAERVTALDWLLAGGNLNGWSMRKGDVGLKAVLEAGTKTGQGHEDQWLAVIAQCGLPLEHLLTVGSEQYTIGDLVEQAKYDVYEGKECSWTLIGLSNYLPIDTEWVARDGSQWTLERIVAMEAGDGLEADQAQQLITDAACGGSHRLIGMTMALNNYRQVRRAETEGPIELTGGWKAAEERILWGIETARQFQQPNGAFSINYFERASNSPDLAIHLGATGHTLELLSLALDEEQLSEPWVTCSVVYLCEIFKKTKDLDLECGALYHAAHGLAVYRQRRFGPR